MPDGDRLLTVLAALDSPHRLRILATLQDGGRNYVSQMARELQIGRPLLHLHLRKLLEAGLVTSRHEVSSDGKAMNYFEIADFSIVLTPRLIAEASQTLTPPNDP